MDEWSPLWPSDRWRKSQTQILKKSIWFSVRKGTKFKNHETPKHCEFKAGRGSPHAKEVLEKYHARYTVAVVKARLKA